MVGLWFYACLMPQEMEDGSQGEGSASWNQNWNRTGTTKTKRPSEEKESDTKKARIPAFHCHLSPAGIDQAVFRELPEDIKKEIMSEKAGELISAEDVLGQPRVCFAEKVQSFSPNSKGDESSAGYSAHLTPACESASAWTHSSSTSFSAEYPKSVLTGMEENPPDSHSFWDLSVEAGASQTAPCVPALDKDEQDSEITSEDKNDSRQVGIVLPPSVDPKTFYELPTDVQEELLAEWKNREPVSKTCIEKPPERPKTNRGKKNTALSSSQSNSLLRYFKPR